MAIEKYRDVADMPPPPRRDRRAATTWNALAAFLSQGPALPPLYAAGLYKFRTLEEASEHREQAVIARMRRTRAAHIAQPSGTLVEAATEAPTAMASRGDTSCEGGRPK